jgi:hypothetical protein
MIRLPARGSGMLRPLVLLVFLLGLLLAIAESRAQSGSGASACAVAAQASPERLAPARRTIGPNRCGDRARSA